MIRPFIPQYGRTVSVTSSGSSNSTSITGVSPTLVLTNTGSTLCYVKLGTGAVTATTSDLPILPGSAIVVSRAITEDVIAVYCATSGNVLATPGDGV